MSETKLERPRRYNLVFLNDSKSQVIFVGSVLVHMFGMKTEELPQALSTIERDGRLVVLENMTREVAETKQRVAERRFRDHGQPLRIVIEPVEYPS